ncbi:uncharacterized protein PHACADRAFT_201666 [Phanerochaete carnosa HHB-10118-sp]|uniref:Uncharacterized protein n=1 Tax=Phanerochaete carnosa (strain HHB-10118-sp) TaxID=650164 RepID=K5VRM6_PHACS|nr:uncharacterized protein PHACADRAFT_201666 [Phanerochaete carnosa HHB-10118-sp]EKM49405.1 hypothetical protein PHACADRAFT_201666 [Phanerochaete carnosa HHB-10118-sp]
MHPAGCNHAGSSSSSPSDCLAELATFSPKFSLGRMGDESVLAEGLEDAWKDLKLHLKAQTESIVYTT